MFRGSLSTALFGNTPLDISSRPDPWQTIASFSPTLQNLCKTLRQIQHLLHASRCAPGTARVSARLSGSSAGQHALLGLTPMGRGHIAVYGDSNCLDSSHVRIACPGLLLKLIAYAAEVITGSMLQNFTHLAPMGLTSKIWPIWTLLLINPCMFIMSKVEHWHSRISPCEARIPHTL